MIHEFADISTSGMRGGLRAERTAPALQELPGFAVRDGPVLHEFFTDDGGGEGLLLPKRCGIGDGNGGSSFIDGGGQRAGPDTHQPRIRDRAHVGIVGGDEIAQRMNADPDAGSGCFVHTALQALVAVREGVRMQLEMPPVLKRSAVIHVSESRPFGGLENSVDIFFTKSRD